MKSLIGVMHGRFQPFHIGHLEYAKWCKSKCDFLMIGIANPTFELTKKEDAHDERHLLSSNPLSYDDRKTIITSTLLSEGFEKKDFQIVPFPINFPEQILNHVPKIAKFFITIYEPWGFEKQKKLQKMNLNVEVLFSGKYEDKLASGADIRNRIRNKQDWKQFVANGTYTTIIQNGFDQKIMLSP